ncbi:movement protein [Carrot red leaf virus]|uniref:Movement protein n=1 Tax=Carrot red leaf virus TaxID=66200 RepID=Q670I0_9VIRU|nr:movement protein [Carrot red leaf virus]AAU04783.1 movement protein [Carrot red leaf virus]
MDSPREQQELNPWLLSTHLQGAHVDVHGLSQSLWYKPHELDEDDEDAEDAALVTHEQWEDPEAESVARSLCFRRTTSRAAPVESSPSARIYQTTLLSAMDYSRHSTNIKSQTCEYVTSRKPHQPPVARSLMSWTPVVNSINFRAQSTNSGSSRMVKPLGALKRLMGRSGTPLRRTNSGSSGREMEVIRR